MEIEVVWREEATFRSTIGINVENVVAAGLDPDSADDLLDYVRRHMDREPFYQQVNRDAAIVDGTEPEFLAVDAVDRRSRISGVA